MDEHIQNKDKVSDQKPEQVLPTTSSKGWKYWFMTFLIIMLLAGVAFLGLSTQCSKMRPEVQPLPDSAPPIPHKKPKTSTPSVPKPGSYGEGEPIPDATPGGIEPSTQSSSDEGDNDGDASGDDSYDPEWAAGGAGVTGNQEAGNDSGKP